MASPRRKSSKRRSTKRRSPKQTSWTRKLQAWRKANTKKDGSLPSMKRAMKACKGKSAKRSKCRSPKRSSKRRTSPKRSSKRRTSKKRSSKRRTSKKRSSKKRSPYTRKIKSYYPDFIGKRVEVFHRPKPVFAPAPAPVTQQGPGVIESIGNLIMGKQQQQQQLSPLFSQALPQGLQKFQQAQQGPVFGPQTAQQYELRTGKRADGLVIGPQTAQAYELRTGKSVISNEEYHLINYAEKDIERTINNNSEMTAFARQVYTEIAIRHMYYELYKLASMNDLSNLPPADKTFDMVMEIIQDAKSRTRYIDNCCWKKINYEFLKELMNIYPQNEVKNHWDNSNNRFMLMWYALIDHDKKAITWLLNNMSYTNKELEDLIIRNDDRFIPGYKELLKPSVLGSITNLIGGFFG